MNVANNDGNFECHTKNELETIIRNSVSNPYDDIWIYDKEEYPCLAILINGNYACVHYFLNDEGDMWQTIGKSDKNVIFMSGGEKSEMPANTVISLEEAIECMKQFYDTLARPNCVEWRAL